jgi:flagellar biosynthesis protein FlhF
MERQEQRFEAATLAEALARMRAALGPEAVIVTTGRSPDGRARVIAAAPAAIESPSTDRGGAPDGAVPRHPIKARLLHHRAGDAVLERFAAAPASADVADLLAAQIAFAPLAPGARTGPVLLAGPPGCGKTVVAAKIAAAAQLAGRSAHLLSVDTIRTAGAEQLRRYALALGCAFDAVADPTALGRALEQVAPGALAVIDTPGLDLQREADRAALAAWIRVANTTPILVLAAGQDAEESAEQAAAIAAFGATVLIATRLDGASRLGNLLSAALAGPLAFGAASLSPRITGGLIDISAAALALALAQDARAAAAALIAARGDGSPG